MPNGKGGTGDKIQLSSDNGGIGSVVGGIVHDNKTGPDARKVICFTKGTHILTPQGERRVEHLTPGDRVVTLDNGPQPVRWIGSTSVAATGALAPVRFAPGVLGNHRALFVSPEHRVLSDAPHLREMSGEAEVLLPAKRLIDDFRVTACFGGIVHYVHILFDHHEIVLANGAPSESYYPGQRELEGLSDAARAEVFSLFPDVQINPTAYGPPSRPTVAPLLSDAMISL